MDIEGDQIGLLMRNARQIRDIVAAAFGPEIFETEADEALTGSLSDYQELARGWKGLAERYRQGVDATGNAELELAIVKVS